MAHRPPQLRNLDVVCYLNSGIQALSSCPRFIKEIGVLCSENSGLDKLGVFNALMLMMNNSGDYTSISSNYIFAQWNKSGQQDSFELLAHVINQVFDEIRQDKETKDLLNKGDINKWLQIKLPLRMNMEYAINCKCGNTEKSPLQSDIALHLSFPNQDGYNRSYSSAKAFDMHKMLEEHFVPETIQDFECGNRGCIIKNATRQLQLYWPLPDTICLHLQRLYWNGSKMEKINDNVTFCNRITIKSDNIKRINSFDNTIVDTHYYLKSVIVHYGGESCGHYTCYKKFNNRWYYTSDTTIREESPTKVLGCNPYILFYEKCDEEEIMPTILKIDPRVNLFIHAMSSCGIFVKWLNKVTINDTSEFMKMLNYLIDCSKGNTQRNKQLEYPTIIKYLKDFKSDNAVLVATKLLDALRNEFVVDSSQSNIELPLLFNVRRNKDCSCCKVYSSSNARDVFLDLLDLGNEEIPLQILLDKYFTKIRSRGLHGGTALKPSRLEGTLSETICIILHNCVQYSRFYYGFRKKITLSNKIIIKTNNESSPKCASNGGLSDKEYYLKSVITDDKCIRNINGLWYEISKNNVDLSDSNCYRQYRNIDIVFYDTKNISIESLNPTNVDSADNRSRSINVQRQCVSPESLSINKYLNSFIQAISACINFIDELYNIPTMSKDSLQHLKYLINLSSGFVESNESMDNYVVRKWCAEANSVDKVMRSIFNDIFEDNSDKKKPLASMIRQFFSCGLHNIPIDQDPCWYIDITEDGNETSLQILVDELFMKGQILTQMKCQHKGCSAPRVTLISKLATPLSTMLCIRLLTESNNIRDVETLIIRKEYWMEPNKNNTQIYDLKSFITTDESWCLRKIDNEWFKVTEDTSVKVDLQSIFDYKPLLLFYESRKDTFMDKHIDCILNCIKSCSIFLDWLRTVEDENNLDIANYLYDRLSPSNVKKQKIALKCNFGENYDIFLFLKSIFESLAKETKITQTEYGCLPMQMWIDLKSEDSYGCGKVIKSETQFILEINLQESSDIQQLLDQYFNKEASNTKNQYRILKKPLPKILCICLNIFVADNKERKKSNHQVKLLEVITLKDYDPSLSPSSQMNHQLRRYKLKSFIEHYGDGSNNKYACYTNIGDNWIFINNDERKDVSWTEILEAQPYIIFYESDDLSSRSDTPSLSAILPKEHCLIRFGGIDIDLQLFNCLQTISACSIFLRNLKSISTTNDCNSSSSWFFDIMDELNSIDRGSLRIDKEPKWQQWANKSYATDIEPFMDILSQLFDSIKLGIDRESIDLPIVIFKESGTQECALKQPIIIDFQLPILSNMANLSFQQFIDGSTQPLLGNILPKTIGFYSTIPFKHFSIDIILRNSLCQECRKKGNDSRCLDNIDCCKKYHLVSMINQDRQCCKWNNNHWFIIGESDTAVIEEAYLFDLRPRILFYESH